MTTFESTVLTESDLHAVWSELMGPLGFSEHCIWMMRIDADRRPVPQIAQIAQAESAPDTVEGHGFVEVLRLLDRDEPGGSFAFLRSRPGRGLTSGDYAWATFLYAAGRAAGVAVEVVHLATDEEVVALPSGG